MLHCTLEISAKALQHNYKVFSQLAGKAKVAPVLKSNAYGHGLSEVYACLAPRRPAWICTNYVDEARLLRKLGFTGRIMIVGPILNSEFAAAHRLKADILIRDDTSLNAWLKVRRQPKIHIKFDTGMNRQGFTLGSEAALAQKLRPYAKAVAGICTHFANVEDVLEHNYADMQLQRFEVVSKAFGSAGLKPLRHAASSASCLLLRDSRFDLSRIGISLYGLWPSPSTRLSFLQTHGEMVDLQPALAWKTWVATVKPVRAGDYIGYGCTYRAMTHMRVAVLPIGYYEGFPRLAGNDQSYVLIHGTRCKVVGRICMNMMMVDVTHLPQVKVMDPVTIIGKDKDETIHAAELATWAQTIHYELLTRLNPLIPRQVVA